MVAKPPDFWKLVQSLTCRLAGLCSSLMARFSPEVEMKVGILIVGSLWWDDTPSRTAWRKSRLAVDRPMPVRAPIRYGRCSTNRKHTYTMTFGGDASQGIALVIPCIGPISEAAGLLSEAVELWGAEDNKLVDTKRLGAGWGCVGAVFRPDLRNGELCRNWSVLFRERVKEPVAEVNADGILEITWPASPELQSSGIGALLATATRPAGVRPTPNMMAEAWADKGSEEYFFNNVACGIRTADDEAILKRLRELRPEWAEDVRYANAVAALTGPPT